MKYLYSTINLPVQHNTAFEGYCQGATLADITHGQGCLLPTRGPGTDRHAGPVGADF